MSETTYNVIAPESGVPVKAWTKGVPLEDAARKQLLNAAQLPFVFKWIAAMPDVHWGIGATVGSVIPTKGAIIPAAVGRGHRLRDDGGPDQSERPRSPGHPQRNSYGDRNGGTARPDEPWRSWRSRRLARHPGAQP